MQLPGPDTSVVELRVPGADPPSPEAVVGGAATVDVAGDGVGRLLRPADRLLRPAPGPVLSTTGRTVPRTVEGYSWSAMAPGRTARVCWALLLPFTLVNAAHWMLPSGRWTRSMRTLLRTVALLLTMMFAAQLTLAGQQLPAARGVTGALPVITAVIVVVIAMHRLAIVRWSAPVTGGDDTGAGVALTGDPDAAGLRALHTATALATVAVLAASDLGLRWLPHPASIVTGIGVLLAATVTLTALLLLPAARAAAPRWRQLPRELRPWAGGWAAAPVLVSAGLLGTGLGAALAFAAQGLAGPGLAVSSAVPLPSWYRPLLQGWGAAGLLVLATSALVAVAALALPMRRGATPAELRMLHDGEMPHGVPGAWRRVALLHRHGHRLVAGATAALLPACVLGWLGAAAGLVAEGPVPDGLVVTGLIVLAAVVALAAAGPLRHAGGTSRIAVVLELMSCWPRGSHPIVPPCPAPKAVPDLVARAETHLADPGARVVLAGQGYGAVLATAAAVQLVHRLSTADRERLGLLTAGAPLQWAYARGFPDVLPHDAAAALAGALQGRWRALCRGTDPAGSATTTWRRQVFDQRLLGTGLRADGTAGALPVARRGTHGAVVLGGEHWLPDPQRGPVEGRRWHSGVLGEADYPSDPEWDAAVALAAGLVTPAPTTPPTARQRRRPVMRTPATNPTRASSPFRSAGAARNL